MKKSIAIALAIGAGVTAIVYVAGCIKYVVMTLGNYNILHNDNSHQFFDH